MIERAAILGNRHRLEVAAALGLGAAVEVRRPARTMSSRAAPDETLDAAMRRHIDGALRASAGRIEGAAGAAARLGVNPHTLRGRMRRLGFAAGAFRASPRSPGAAGRTGEGHVPLDGAVRDHIEEALRAAYGRIEGPAARLGVNPHTLRARMRKLGICWRDYRQARRQAADHRLQACWSGFCPEPD